MDVYTMYLSGPQLHHSEIDENRNCKRLLTEECKPDKARAEIIPKHIMQYWDQTDPPADVMECIKTWHVLERMGFSHSLFCNEAAHRFISSHYYQRYEQAYEACHHPAMRSDFFRLAYLYVKGGVYSDADNELVSPKLFLKLFKSSGPLNLPPLFQEKIDSITSMLPVKVGLSRVCEYSIYAYFANDPIICTPRHPIIRLALDRAAHLILANRDAGAISNIHAVTGPSNITIALSCYLDYFQSVSFKPIINWSDISQSNESLKYKAGNRNWRSGASVESG